MDTKLPHDDIVPFRNSDSGKKQQVAEMFNNIAFRYDLVNRMLSMGIDIGWRKKAIRMLLPLQPKQVLDVATGTGDFAILTHKMLKPDHITGIDISDGMLNIGRNKLKTKGLDKFITLNNGDGETINHPDNTFDAVTVAFGVRNFEHLEKGLAEMLRVLRPGGQLIILEFSKPKTGGFRTLYNWYMSKVTPQFGQLISKNKAAYQYLNDSVKAFPEGAAFINILNKTGYCTTAMQPLSLGICTIYSGKKPS